MVDFGITAVWCKTPEQFRQEFKLAFNADVEDNRDGIHSYVFCQYHKESAYAEVIYAAVINNTVVFLLNTTQYELMLDEKFVARSFHTNDDSAYMFLTGIFDSNDVKYIGECCSDVGEYYRIFSLNNPSQIAKVTKMMENKNIPIESIHTLDDETVMNICVEFMDHTSREFSNQIDEAKKNDEAYEGIEENPFQDRFFDRYENQIEEEPTIYE